MCIHHIFVYTYHYARAYLLTLTHMLCFFYLWVELAHFCQGWHHSFLFVLLHSAYLSSAALPLQTNEVTNRIKCRHSRWWIHHREVVSALWKHPTLPMSSSKMWARVSFPRRPWSAATPWPLTLLPTLKTGWASLRYTTYKHSSCCYLEHAHKHHKA